MDERKEVTNDVSMEEVKEILQQVQQVNTEVENTTQTGGNQEQVQEEETTEELQLDTSEVKKYPWKVSKTKIAAEFLSVIAESQGIKPTRRELRQAAKIIGKIDRIDENGNLKPVYKLTEKEKERRKKKRKMEKKARKKNRGK